MLWIGLCHIISISTAHIDVSLNNWINIAVDSIIQTFDVLLISYRLQQIQNEWRRGGEAGGAKEKKQ